MPDFFSNLEGLVEEKEKEAKPDFFANLSSILEQAAPKPTVQ